MKKALMILGVIALVLILCMAVVACDPQEQNGNDNDNPNVYEQAKYTVTFKTNGDFVLTNSVLKDVPSGSKIEPPKDKDGKVITPIKKGYTFQFWSADGTKAFDFANDVITKNTTLTAIYTNNVYKHNPVLTAKLIYNSDGSVEVDENGYIEGHATLTPAELDKNTTTIKSTYNGSLANIACPTVTDEADKFCFWYYIDSEGKPVQFTKWARSGDASVQMLTKYNFTEELTLYPMFYSNLPEVKVVYCDSASEGVYNEEHSYRIGDYVPQSEAYIAQKTGYAFDEWYYILKNEDEEDVQYSFGFLKDESEDDATSVADAAGITDNFTNGTLYLYARWRKQISLVSVDDFTNLLAALNVAEPNDEQKKAIDEILSAEIFVDDINFGGATLQPLFENHTFTGTIKSNKINAETQVVENAVFSNGIFEGKSSASVFGNVSGKVSNIDFDGITLSVDKTQDTNVFALGFVATTNGGEIANCNVRDCIVKIEGLKTVVFGGISAYNNGSAGATGKGYIHNCSFQMGSISVDCEALTFGGISGEGNSSSRCEANTVEVTFANVATKDDGIPGNGRPALRIGGLVGSNGGVITQSQARVTISALSSQGETCIGGATAVSTGTVGRTSVALDLCNESAPALVGATLSQTASIGGIVGKNEGTVINSYCDSANLYVKAINSNSIIAVGGIVGNNFTDKTDQDSSQTSGIGCINKSYAVGEIVITQADGTKGIVVYAGGIAGRNSQSKIASDFAIVNITIQNNGTNHLGYLLGSLERGARITSGWYANQNSITLNGEKHEGENFDVIMSGTATEIENFSNVAWVIGAGDTRSTLGFDDTVWMVAGDGSLPTLKR